METAKRNTDAEVSQTCGPANSNAGAVQASGKTTGTRIKAPRILSDMFATIKPTTQAEWKRILNLMTAPCTIAQMTEAGIERHTAEIVRAKTLAAIVAVQTTVKLEKKAVLAFETVPEKQKRAKTVLSANNMEYQVVIAADANGNHIGTVLPAKSILKETMYVSDELDDWISDHGVDESTVLDPGNDIDLAWHKFVSPFRSISMKYLNDYLQWFCFLRQQEVIGKSKKDIVNMLWKMINEQERTLSNRNFRNR